MENKNQILRFWIFKMQVMFLEPALPFLVTNKVIFKINAKLLTQSSHLLNFFLQQRPQPSESRFLYKLGFNRGGAGKDSTE